MPVFFGRLESGAHLERGLAPALLAALTQAMNMLRCGWLWAFLVTGLLGVEMARGASKEDEDLGLNWQKGPQAASLRNVARLKVPAGFRFLDHKETKKWLERMGNEPDGNELGLVQNTTNGWVVIFEFDDIGYVKDDEKNQLDKMGDELLASYKKGAEAQNERRQERGMSALHVLGWQVKPNYNDETKNLEWCLLGESRGEKFVNHNVRVLGRRGVTKVTLIEDADKFDATLPAFRSLLKDFSYTTGESYAEFKQGDKIAKAGLGALVLGGAAAAAYKVGLLGGLLAFFKKGFKLIIVAIVAIGAGIKRLFGRITGKNSD